MDTIEELFPLAFAFFFSWAGLGNRSHPLAQSINRLSSDVFSFFTHVIRTLSRDKKGGISRVPQEPCSL